MPDMSNFSQKMFCKNPVRIQKNMGHGLNTGSYELMSTIQNVGLIKVK